MNVACSSEMRIGRYRGAIRADYRAPDLLARLEEFPGLLGGESARPFAAGRNRHYRVSMVYRGEPLSVAVKRFGRQSFLKDRMDAVRGSKAMRAYRAAVALQSGGVGTPAPIGFLDFWRGGRLVESYFLSEYQTNITDFKSELVRLFRDDPDCGKLMTLMGEVAKAVRSLHAAGVAHHDLGNQNILLRRKGEAAWGDVQFIDLNRARVDSTLSLQKRARDLSRIYLPSDLLRVFMEMVWAPQPPPRAFRRWEDLYRRVYAVHAKSRWIRHPLRTRRNRLRPESAPGYPSEKDLWIWDEKSVQAVSALERRDRKRYQPVSSHVGAFASSVRALVPVWTEYRRLLGSCYRAEVAMEARIGMAIGPTPETASRETALLEGLGRLPVLIRFYCHEPESQSLFSVNRVRELREKGHSVSIALVQDRQAVLHPARWLSFVSRVMDQVHASVEWVEVGHAINRVKWGIWGLEEHRRLLEGMAGLCRQYPGIQWMGPAVIDFEYAFLVGALRNLPAPWHFQALSHHLYVDRRGAPENRQGPFSALEKFALARAIARWAPACDDRLIVSEVNWPLKGEGVYSPVGSPYESPGPRRHDPSVSEEAYADYMLRYLVMAICSGMVHRVYWWKLVARGFGLVDDRNPTAWRERPAYAKLKHFLRVLGRSTFVEKMAAPEAVHLFVFRVTDGGRVCFAYSSGPEQDVTLPWVPEGMEDGIGNALGIRGNTVRLSGRPVYLRLGS